MSNIPGVNNVIAIASGKGGVGKSTTAVNLALAIQSQGHKTGILDADIYGPNQPHLLASFEKPEVASDDRLNPVTQYGLQTMSMAYLIDKDMPVVWRAPIVIKMLSQLIFETNWQALDYLILDLPPGTGDVQLTLAQKLSLDGAVIVTTPQDVALLDVSKSIAMLQKVKVPILGIIENMSLHTCKQCGHQEAIFGSHGADQLAQKYQSDVLARLPLDIKIREQSDAGKPIVLAQPEDEISQIYLACAKKIISKIAAKPKSKFPKIVVEN